MKKYSLLYIAFGLLVILWILNFIALEFYFYWTVWWYDLMVHTLAGFSGGLAAFWFLRSFGTIRLFYLVITAVMIVGTSYEVFEYIYQIIPPGNYWIDTFTDLLADGVGALLACLYAMRVRIPESVSESPDD